MKFANTVRLFNRLPGRVAKAWRITRDFGRFVDVQRCTYNKDGLVSFHNCDFMHDPVFREAYALGKAAGSWGNYDIEWRAYVACWAASKGAALDGDFVECGVNRGGLSRAVMHYINFARMTDRKFYLLDTYCGFPERYADSAAETNLHDYSECYEAACETFRPFPNAILVRGIVPDSLSMVKTQKVCYLSLDMNCAEPEIASAEYFWPKMVSGAVIVHDDYGYLNQYMPQKVALDNFAAKHNVEVLTLPTGQGLVFKS